MSASEITDLCGKEHKHAIRDRRTMLVRPYDDEHLTKDTPQHNRKRHSEVIRKNADAILSQIWDDPDLDHLQHGWQWEHNNRGYVSSFHLDREHTITRKLGYDA